MNIEQLAIEHGEETFSAISRNENGEAVVGVAYIFTKDELESLAKAYAQQQSEPVAEVNTLEEWITTNMPAGTIISDPKWWSRKIHNVIALTQPPNTVRLEQYNKVVDAIRDDSFAIGFQSLSQYRTALLNISKRENMEVEAIAEAERSDK